MSNAFDGVRIMKERQQRRNKQRAEQEANIQEWLQSLIDDPETHVFVMCRDLGHPKRIEKMWGTPTFHRRKLSCVCGHSYEQNIHRGRIVWKGNVHYPTGYLKPKDGPPGRMTRDLWRHMSAMLTEFDSDMPPGLEELLKEMKRHV